MNTEIVLSVIIPTRDRADRLAEALDSLSRQTLQCGVFEVIVVDDGSQTPVVSELQSGAPFELRLCRQKAAGSAVARNRGAGEAAGKLLVFMDDDVIPEPGALQALADCLEASPQTVAMGSVRSLPPALPTVFSKWAAAGAAWPETPAQGWRDLPPVSGNTQLLAVACADYDFLGGFRDPTGGWPNWDDVDFGYRAHLAGFRLVEVFQARATHRDASLLSLEATLDRSYRAAHAAPRLFALHPGLVSRLPMFEDKVPHDPGDALLVRIRKTLRPLASSRPVIALLGKAVLVTEKLSPRRGILRHLYRWLIGAALYRGYRDGLQAADGRSIAS